VLSLRKEKPNDTPAPVVPTDSRVDQACPVTVVDAHNKCTHLPAQVLELTDQKNKRSLTAEPVELKHSGFQQVDSPTLADIAKHDAIDHSRCMPPVSLALEAEFFKYLQPDDLL